MSHTITVTKVTTSSSAPMVFNSGYACNIHGALKILETLLDKWNCWNFLSLLWMVVTTERSEAWTFVNQSVGKVFGSICLGLMLYYTSFKGTNSFGMFGHEMYFILTAFGCLLCTFLLLVSSCWSFTSSSLLSRTSFEILFHLVACALYLAAGITLLTKTLDTHSRYKGEVYDAKIAAAVFGIMNGALYLLGAVFSFRIFRQG